MVMDLSRRMLRHEASEYANSIQFRLNYVTIYRNRQRKLDNDLRRRLRWKWI